MKFKINYTWYVKLRGRGSMIVEAATEEKAEEIAYETAPVDYNKYIKMMDSEFDIVNIEALDE